MPIFKMWYHENMDNCLFCKIIRKEIPSDFVYEDAEMAAILDINPVNIGHTLIIPKEHYANIYELPDELLAKIAIAAKKLSIAIKSAMEADGINIEMNNDVVAGQLVPHAHIHIVPRFDGDGFTHWHGKRKYNEGEAKEVSLKIKSFLG